MKILLDTNFLIDAVRFNVDVFSEIDRICHFKYEILVLDKTVKELNQIMSTKGKEKRFAMIAKQLIKHKKIRILNCGEGNVDELLLKIDGIVATQDKALIKKLKQLGKKVICFRQKKYLIMK